ncbi:hypothetical protein [Lysobacter sp. HA35]
MKRWWLVPIAVVAALIAIRACGRSTRVEPAHGVSSASLEPSRRSQSGTPLAVQGPSSAAVDIEQLIAAGNVVHGYLQSLAQDRVADADAAWRAGRHPGRNDEGGLRSVLPARETQIRTLEPVPLDGVTLHRIRVPVRLRLSGADGVLHVFEGDYTVERASDAAPWQIAAAEVHARLD